LGAGEIWQGFKGMLVFIYKEIKIEQNLEHKGKNAA